MACECGLGAKCVIKSTRVGGESVIPVPGSTDDQAHHRTYQLTGLAQRGREFLRIQVPVSI